MFEIDLLKGQGIPIKSRRGGLVVLCAAFSVPLIVLLLMYVQYIVNSSEMRKIDQRINERERNMQILADVVRERDRIERECKLLHSCLVDVSKSIKTNVQWSELVRQIIDAVPRSMLLSKLNVKVDSASKTVTGPNNETRTVSYAVKTLQMSICGDSKVDNGPAVKEFMRALSSSKDLKDRLDSSRMTGQQVENLHSVEMMRYDIDCAFKP